MGLKDWKKVNKNIWERKTGVRWLEIITRGMKTMYNYNVIIWEPYREIIDKTFRTKSAALKFARTYMRTH